MYALLPTTKQFLWYVPWSWEYGCYMYVWSALWLVLLSDASGECNTVSDFFAAGKNTDPSSRLLGQLAPEKKLEVEDFHHWWLSKSLHVSSNVVQLYLNCCSNNICSPLFHTEAARSNSVRSRFWKYISLMLTTASYVCVHHKSRLIANHYFK